MITNAELSEDGPERYWGYHSSGRPSGFTFLKDVEACDKTGFAGSYRIYGTPITPEEFKSEIGTLLDSKNNTFDHVLYSIHGFNVHPWGSYESASNFADNYEDRTGYLVIPINWRNKHGAQFAS